MILLKKILLALALLASVCSASAEVIREGNTFAASASSKPSSDTPTNYKWRDKKGDEHTIFLHRYTRGSKIGQYGCYVLKVSSKTGKEYKYFLPDNVVSEIITELGL